MRRFSPLFCLAISGVCLVATYISLSPIASDSLSLAPAHLDYRPYEAEGGGELAARLVEVLGARSTQLAMLLLECVVAMVALAIVVAWILPRVRFRLLADPVSLLAVTSFIGVVGLRATDAYEMTRSEAPVQGFLSQLLTSIPSVVEGRTTLAVAKLVGETSGVILAFAAASLVAFNRAPTVAELAERYRWFQRMLYVASLLFVVGTFVSRANFAWVVAHWELPTKSLSDAAATLVTAGVTQASVAYSVALAAAFIPPRLLLDAHLNALVPEPEQQKLLTGSGVSINWQSDVSQLLTLLAPILSGALVDAIAKL